MKKKLFTLLLAVCLFFCFIGSSLANTSVVNSGQAESLITPRMINKQTTPPFGTQSDYTVLIDSGWVDYEAKALIRNLTTTAIAVLIGGSTGGLGAAFRLGIANSLLNIAIDINSNASVLALYERTYGHKTAPGLSRKVEQSWYLKSDNDALSTQSVKKVYYYWFS